MGVIYSCAKERRGEGEKGGAEVGDTNEDDGENIIIVLAYKLFINVINCILRIKHPLSHTCSVGQLKYFENLKNVYFLRFQ